MQVSTGWRRRTTGRRAAALIAALLAATTVAGCAAAVYPPLTARDPGDAAFKARMADRYPPGTPSRLLRAELAASGFDLVEDRALRRASAFYRTANLPCFSAVRVDWTEDRRGHITELQVQRHDCT